MKSYASLKVLLCSIFLGFITACGGGSSSGGGVIVEPLSREDKWVEDIDYLTSQMKSIHPNLFHSIEESTFNQESERLKANISDLTDNQMFTEILKLVALPGVERDGHMSVSFFDTTEMRLVPLRFFRFSDGVFVVDAGDGLTHLIGTQLVGIGAYELDDVNASIDLLNASDNLHSKVGRRILNYIMPDLLEAVELVNDANSIDYHFVDAQGNSLSETISPILPNQYDLGLSYNLPTNSGSFYLSNSDTFWLNHFTDEQVLYIKLNEVREVDATGKTLNEFADEILNIVYNNQLSQIILDLRQNNGGNNQLISGLINFLQDSEINQSGKLVVFSDSQTFSAAGNFFAEIDYRTNATLVGTSPGGSGSQYGDTQAVRLPHSRIVAHIPTIYWEFGDPAYQPVLHPVDIEIEPTSQQYFNNLDPLLELYLN